MTTMRHAEERFWPARRKQLQPTLDETLPRVIERHETKGKGPKKKGRPPRVRAVHRLDRETSGLMVFARTPVAETHLVQQFRKHTIHRRYLAIVQGRIEAQTIESNLVLDRGDGRRGSTQLPDVGKRAVTHVRPIEFLDGYTLVECTLETGRTHQIRIHLSEQGHPVCGDKMYSQPLFEKPIVDRSGAPRVALHAAELGLVHPVTGEQLDFKMPFPPDLVEFVNRLRKQKAKPPAK
jgi:23S rRNA pseudouridine1911/1915/1917 synthase